MLNFLSSLVVLSSCFWFVWCRTLRYLRYLQQDEYDPKRFWAWLIRLRAFDRKGTSLILLALAISWLADSHPIILGCIDLATALGLYGVVKMEQDPCKHGKITLKMTERAQNIHKCALSIYVIFNLSLLFILPFWFAQALLLQLTPIYLIGSTFLLRTTERKRQSLFIKEAKTTLASVAPYVIGITGSYGKTSTKLALGQVLQITLGPTFWPVKGINTPMGNVREIRSGLRSGHRYAIFEMGAYGRGSVARLCAITPPQAAIITTIGTAHLERFKSQENIYFAKAELAQALPKNGILICNGDDAGARRISEEFASQTTLRYGFDATKGPLDCHIISWQTTEKGTQFTLSWKGHTYEGFTVLFGKPNLSNLAAVFTLACTLGAHPEYVLAAIRILDPVDNRLQVKKCADITFMHDAYNSNPIGFSAALEVMGNLPAKRRILMTPGMIELGPLQQQENERLGKAAAALCDFAIIVGNTNRKALLTGLKHGGFSLDNTIVCETRDQAMQELKKLQSSGDLILIENDLVDLYENKEKF